MPGAGPEAEAKLNAGRLIRGFPVGTTADLTPRLARPIVTLTLIAVNVAVYAATAAGNAMLSISERWLSAGGFIPVLVLDDPSNVYRAFTSMFLHANLLHIFFNMYFLYMFGRAVENALGHTRYLLLYLLSGLLAAVFHTAYSHLQGPASLAIPAIGASGAISGVLGAYMMLYPGTRLSACFWFFLFPFCYTTRAAYFLLFWFALQVAYGYTSVGAAVAFFAHAGGFIAGIALLLPLLNRERHALLRSYGPVGESLFGVVWSWGWRRVRGLGGAAKALFSLLSLTLLAGSLYVYADVTASEPVVSMVSMRVWFAGATSSSSVALLHEDGRLVPTGLETVPAPVRIVFNRLWGSGLLYNPELAGKEVSVEREELMAYVPACDRYVKVPTRVIGFSGVYDAEGLLLRGSGSIHTYVVQISWGAGGCSASVGERMSAAFQATTLPELELSDLVSPMALLSFLTTLLALLAVRKDRELAIVG